MAQVRDTYMGKYVDVAAGQTGAAIKTTSASVGAIGDYIDTIVIIPETTTPGTVALLDGSTSVNILVSGTFTLTPITIKCGWRAVNANGWSLTTGTNVHVRVSGRF